MLKYSQSVPSAQLRMTKGGLPNLAQGGPAPPIEDIMNAIFPPSQFEESGVPMARAVSTQAATRLDVIALQETLDAKLLHHQVKELGMCPIRSALYNDIFDELIRQVTINCPERGLLLVRIRDNARRTIEAHKALYESSVSYAIRKAQLAEEGRPQMIEQIDLLKAECAELEAKVTQMHAKCEAVEKRELDRRQSDERRRQEEMQFLSTTNQQLSQYLKNLLESNTKK